MTAFSMFNETTEVEQCSGKVFGSLWVIPTANIIKKTSSNEL